MYFGIQLEAPVGFEGFLKGKRYYYLGDCSTSNVRLAWFHKEPTQWRVYLITLSRQEFEVYLLCDRPKLKVAAIQYSLPEWLKDDEGINFEAIERYRPGKPQRTYKYQAESRLLPLSEALINEDEILASPDPIRKLNDFAYKLNKSVHPHRFCLWFFAFILHGHNIWALKKARGSGNWDRSSEKHKNKKYGLKSNDEQTCFNSPSAPFANKFITSYLKRCGPGVNMMSIYIEAMIEDFGYVVAKDVRGNLTFIHPSGGSAYSYGQFRYRVVQGLSLEAVQETRYGAARIRRTKIIETGNYSSQYSRLMEGFEVDAYYCSDYPKSMFSEKPSDRLAVAVGVCGKSGYRAGFGFSIGNENQEAYRAMLFCCVAPRHYIEKIYGLPEGILSDYLALGFPPNFRSDRGPAGYGKLVDELMFKFPIKSVVPSYTPQSKAQIESGHPKDVIQDGAPSYIISDLTLPQMIKREILLCRAQTLSSDISDRLSDQEIDDFEQDHLPSNPYSFAKYLMIRGATAARSMSLEDAVRLLWTPIKLTVDRKGVKYRHHYFTSDAFKASGIEKLFGPLPSIELDGYHLSAVFLSCWVEVKGKLFQVEYASRSRQDLEDLLVSKSQVDDTADKLKSIRARTRRVGVVAKADSQKKFMEATGKKWSAGSRVQGVAKRTSGTEAVEVSIVKGKSRVRKVA